MIIYGYTNQVATNFLYMLKKDFLEITYGQWNSIRELNWRKIIKVCFWNNSWALLPKWCELEFDEITEKRKYPEGSIFAKNINDFWKNIKSEFNS